MELGQALRHRSNRILVGIYPIWAFTLVAIGVGYALHHSDVGTAALIAQVTGLLGVFVGNWISRGE